MPRHCTNSELISLTIGDLNAKDARRVREHIAECPACATEAEQTARLFATARTLATEPVSEILQTRTAARLEPTRRPIPFLRPVAWGGVTVAISLAVVAFLPGTLTRPTPAFARVEEALEGIKTVTWTETSYNEFTMKGKTTKTTSTYQHWAQMNPARLITYQKPQKYNYFHSVSDGTYTYGGHGTDGTVSMYFKQDARVDWRFGFSGESKNLSQYIRNAILFPRDWQSDTGEQKDANRWETMTHTPWSSEKVSLKDSPTLLFHTVLTYTARKPKVDKWMSSERKEDWQIWVDPDTYRIRRRTVKYLPNPNYYASTVTADNFRYDDPIPSDVLTIPEPTVGESYRFVDYTEAAKKARELSEADQKTIIALLAKFSQAWNQHDSEGILQLWDFNYDSLLRNIYHAKPLNDPKAVAETRHHWSERARHGIPYQTWKLGRVVSGRWSRDQLYVRKANDTFPPTVENQTVAVETIGIATTATNKTPDTYRTTFILKRDGKGFKVLFANMYAKPIKVKLSDKEIRLVGRP